MHPLQGRHSAPMGAVEFFSRLIDNLLSWPVLILVIVLIFRRQIAGLIGRIRSYEGLGQKLTFGDQLAETEDSVDAAVESIASSPDGTDAPTRPALDSADPLAREAEENPSFAVIQGWEGLSRSLQGLITTALGPGRGTPKSIPRATRELERAGIVNDRFVQAVEELRQLRNKVAHGQHNPSPGEAVAYVASARELSRAAETLSALERQRPRPRPTVR